MFLESPDIQTSESLYSIDNAFKVGQCFRDCDKAVIKAEAQTKALASKAKVAPKSEMPKVQPLIAKRAQPEKKPQQNETNKKLKADPMEKKAAQKPESKLPNDDVKHSEAKPQTLSKN